MITEVETKLSAWLKHCRDSGSQHIAIPCEAAEEILSLLQRPRDLVPVLTTIAEELKKIRMELSVSNELRSGGGFPEC